MVPYPSIRSLLNSQMRWHGDKPFSIEIDSKGNRNSLSFTQLFERASQGANFLKSIGITFGDRIEVSPQNMNQTLVQFFSIWMIGAAAVMNQKELSNINQSVPEFSEAAKVFLDDWRESETKLSGYPKDYVLERKSKLDDEVMIIGKMERFGKIKAVTLTHYNLLVNSMAIADRLKLEAKSLVVCDIPFSDPSGIIGCVVSALYAGCPVLLPHFENVNELFHQLQNDEDYFLFTEDHKLSNLIKEDLNQHLTLPRIILCSHHILTPELILQIYMKHGMRIIPGLSLPEATSFTSFLSTRLSDDKYEKYFHGQQGLCVGKPLRSNEFDIQDSNGVSLPEGDIGELVIRGHNVMKGYLNDNKANQEVFKHGWLRTGENGVFRHTEDGEKLYYISG